MKNNIFCCKKCGKTFKRRENMDYHITEAVCEEKTVNCNMCNCKFSSKATMYRHIRSYCKVKKQNDSEKEEILNKLMTIEDNNKREIAILRKENSMLKRRVIKLEKPNIALINNNVVNNNCTTNINNGTINNIILVGYGKEDISKLDNSEILKALQSGFYSTIKLTEAVHFNPKYPEYHNIYISNMKDKYAMMFDGNIWTLTTKEDLINQIYEYKKIYIEENLEEFMDSLPVSRKKALERWLDTDDEDAKIKEIKSNIKLLLYNSRKLIHNTSTVLLKQANKNKVLVSRKDVIKCNE